MKKMITALACASVLMTGCAPSVPSVPSVQEKTAYTNLTTDVGFDTIFSYKENAAYEEEASARFEGCSEILRKYNDLFDIYNSYEGVNNLKTINDNAGIAPVEVDPVIIDMLKMARDFYDLSRGEFDITMGALLHVWHNYRDEGIDLNTQGKLGNLPSDEELQEAAKHKGWEHVIIDEEASTVYIDDPDVSLDVGGIAKGYATEAAAVYTQQDGMESGFVNVGRNIRTVGNKAEGLPWRVGIADPEGAMVNGVVALDKMGSFSFVTSGDYERYYVASDGGIYSHIVDPETLYPATLYRSVTILTEDSAAADCLSTTLFTMSIDEGMQVLEEYEAYSGQHASAVWMMSADKKQDYEGKSVGEYFVVWTEDLEGTMTWMN